MKPENKRGGRRIGAGRKPVLTELEKLWVGGECEARWRSKTQEKSRARFEAHCEDLVEAHKRIQAVRLEERRNRASNPNPLGSGEDRLDELVADVREEIASANLARGENPNNRLWSYRIIRPYDESPGIIAEVAKLASEQLGRKVSTRMVERAWDKFRKHQQQVSLE